MIDQKAYDRFMSKAYPEPNSGCWLWIGSYATNGYGAFFFGRQVGAHVFSYLAHVGDIPLGLVVHHRCTNKACVNPSHLEAVTPSENLRLAHIERAGACKMSSFKTMAGKKLAAWLQAHRVQKHVFANRVNVGPPTVSRLLSGERTPSLELATRISKQTGGFVTPDDWVTPSAERQEQTEAAA